MKFYGIACPQALDLNNHENNQEMCDEHIFAESPIDALRDFIKINYSSMIACCGEDEVMSHFINLHKDGKVLIKYLGDYRHIEVYDGEELVDTVPYNEQKRIGSIAPKANRLKLVYC